MIKLGKAVYSILSSATGVTQYVGLHIFPILVPEVTNLPCVVYERQGNDESNKDGHAIYDVEVYLTIIAKEYEATVNIAQACHDALSEYTGTAGETNIMKCRFVNVNEVYAEEVYMQRLTFNVKCR
jgi:hypothetical protein